MKSVAAAWNHLLNDAAARRGWCWLLAALLLATSWLAVASGPAPVPGGDKLHHVLGFAVLALVASLAGAPGWRHAGWAAAGLLLYGGLIEAVQSQLPWRSAEWADWLADALGTVLGLALAAGLRLAAAPRR